MTRNRANNVVLTRGDNRVEVYDFGVERADRPEDLIVSLTRRRLAGFGGTLAVSDYTRDNYETQWAGITSHGTFAGKRARLDADLWIVTEDGEGLLAIVITTAISGSKSIEQAEAVVREFSQDLP